MSEAQRQDEIEVHKIDQKPAVVTFKNHGETQELPLVAASPSSTPAPVVTGIPANPAACTSDPRPCGGFARPGGCRFQWSQRDELSAGIIPEAVETPA